MTKSQLGIKRKFVYLCLLLYLLCHLYSRLSITSTFKGNRKKVRVIGSSKKITEIKIKKQFLLHSEHFNQI